MINQLWFEKINALAGRNIWLDRLAVFFSVYAGYVIVAVLVYLLIFKSSARNKAMVIISLISAVISRGLVTTLIRIIYPHPRPFAVLADVKQLIPESGSSFPSGHAAFFFALSAVVYVYNKKLGVIFIVISAVMGLARIFTGVHWPLDIAGGILVGLATGLSVNRYANKFLKTKTPVSGVDMA